MTDKNSRLHMQMDGEHDDELNAAELAALEAQLETSEGSQALAENMRRADALLSQTPQVSPSPGFAARVMAAIAAMPAYARRELGVGLALALAFVTVLAVPLMVAALVVMVVAALDGGTVAAIFQGAVEAAGYVVGLGRDAAAELRAWAQESPAVVVLATALLPLVALWSWLLWVFSGRGWPLNRTR